MGSVYGPVKSVPFLPNIFAIRIFEVFTTTHFPSIKCTSGAHIPACVFRFAAASINSLPYSESFASHIGLSFCQLTRSLLRKNCMPGRLFGNVFKGRVQAR